MTPSKDLTAGVIFVAIGVFVVVIGRGYPIGTALRMGPGYFPIIVGALTALVGLLIAVRVVVVGSDPMPAMALRPIAMLCLSIVAFSLLLRPFGLVAATVALLFLSRAAAPGASILGTVVLATGLLAGSVLIFVEFLGVPLRLWPV